MTTYTHSFNLSAALTGQGDGSGYPLYVGSPTFAPDITMYVKNGDIIEIDSEKGTLKVHLTNKELLKRKKKWKPKKIEYNSGTLWKYSQTVGPAFKGAVTHPGASKEKKSYADI